MHSAAMPIAVPALAYAAAVFAVGFVLGTLRVLWLAPTVGELPAVAMELPVMLAASWVAAGAVLRRWPVDRRLAMGALALAVLLACEAGLAVLLGGGLRGFLAHLATAPGALGLAGQVAFALIPWLRR
jgi:hypothetical protein